MKLAQNVCLNEIYVKRLDHLGSKTRSPGQIKGKTCQHSRGHIFEVIIMNIAQNVCLDDF